MEKRKNQQNQVQGDEKDPLDPMEHQSGQTMPKPKPQTRKPKPTDEQDPLEPMEHQSGQSRPGSQKGFAQTDKPKQQFGQETHGKSSPKTSKR